MASQVDLDVTISVLQGGVTSISPTAAVRSIDKWIGVLEGAGFAEIASTLGALRAELTSGRFSGARIGPLLIELGMQTERAASGAEPGMAGKLQHLASLLLQSGGAIMSLSYRPAARVDVLHP